jgi:hypothetical protein
MGVELPETKRLWRQPFDDRLGLWARIKYFVVVQVAVAPFNVIYSAVMWLRVRKRVMRLRVLRAEIEARVSDD